LIRSESYDHSYKIEKINQFVSSLIISNEETKL
jgi:hypothetical protein